MNACAFLLLGCLATSAGEEVIDSFQYADTPSAQRAWVADRRTEPVKMVGQGDRQVLQFEVPFAAKPKLERTVIDRQVELNLASAGGFTLELDTPSTEAAGRLSLYFRSGDGWYAAGKGLAKNGRQTILFSKASFSIENTPTGWHAIDAVRISIWRGQAKDTSVRLLRLAAVRNDVALVIPAAGAHKGENEIDAALKTADVVAGMLAELGLGADAVEDTAVAHGALDKRSVAILAYNPRLSSEAIPALRQFVEQGGKLLVCYKLPRQLQAVLGFDQPKYVSRKRPGQFAEIRFDASDMPGLPKLVKQSSWNITEAQPAGHNARVIGRWFDDAGAPTGYPAMLLSDRGAYFSHIILADDRSAKKQMLAAVLGHLSPSLWPQMAQAEMERIGTVGHIEGVDRLIEYVTANGNAAAVAQLEAAKHTLAEAKSQLKQKDYPTAVKLARQTHDQLADAYYRAQPSPRREGRALWNHSGTGAYDGDWQRSAKELADAGFNMIIPNMLWGGRAHYASDVLPRSSTYEKYGDQISQCVAACKQHGIEVHVWKVNYNLSGAPKEFVDKILREKRNQVTSRGEEKKWLCPSHPKNFKLELESMLEVARKYDVDGLHFDYIRYPGGDCCFCDGCRQRFEAESGRKVANWPKDCTSGDRCEEYRDWRCKQINRLVEAVHLEARKIKPGIKISAAVFGSYPSCRASVGQDWPEWIKAGYLDFVCPMDYTQSDVNFVNLVTNQLDLIKRRIPIYPGIGAWRLPADRTVGQIHHARQLHADGFTIFNYSSGLSTDLFPGLKLGVGAQPAVPPHSD